MKSRSLVVITPGDPEGIGPEIAWKVARARPSVPLLFVGARKPFDQMGAPVIEARADSLYSGPPKSRHPYIWLLPAPRNAPRSKFLPGYQSGWAIVQATQLVLSGKAGALVTGPISKERLQKGGFSYSGHTDFLADLCRTKNVTMMLANDILRISLVTTHLALKDVPRELSREKLRRTVNNTVDYLRRYVGISKPKIAVAALNPHAGEAGIFGKEEICIITPEIQALQKLAKNRYQISGPLPADTLFAKHALAKRKDRFDAVICMYHDQGLIPVKLLDFPRTVNITLGLPMIRTSVDHGVGFDIAQTGKADPSSLHSAIELAAKMIRNQRRS